MCSFVFVPARSFCPICFKPLGEEALREVGPWGTVIASAGGEAGKPSLALIRLDGADNSFLHRASAPTGSRVRAKFRPSLEGDALPLLLLELFEQEEEKKQT